ncbi:MAG: hypothetical protein XD91_0373 [Clostridiales bacterium 38_11]|nr:MAG: hypothetical protein XD91_0373 [Clostridiales bacterium 38_11]HBH12862.1 hypothetical protein [Clostridiales bacterium]
MKELIGSELRKAIEVIEAIDSDSDIIEIAYIKGTNKNFLPVLEKPIVVRHLKIKDRHNLTVAYF